MLKTISRVATVLALFIFSSQIRAGSTSGLDELIKSRQQTLLDDQRVRLKALDNLPGQKSLKDEVAHYEDDRCFFIKTINLEGASALSKPIRQTLVKPYLNKCLGVSSLNHILRVITGFYIEKGWVTSRAYLPQQDLSSGHLNIVIVEGLLEKLSTVGVRGITRREIDLTFPGRERQLLNLREIEQMVDQLNRLPSHNVQMELTPGLEVGGSIVQVKNTYQKPWRLNFSRHNDGQRGIGEQRWTIGLAWDSPLGLADQLSLRAGQDAVSDHKRSSRNASLNYNIPWGWWSLSYDYGATGYRSSLDIDGNDFSQTGDSQRHQLRIERLIHRKAVSKSSLIAGISSLQADNYIGDARLPSSNRLSEVQYGINHGRRVGSGFLNIDLGMQQGISALGAQKNERAQSVSPSRQPDARYRKYSGVVSFLQPFQFWGERLVFTSVITGQHSEDMLFGHQQIGIGGLSSVRGFKEQSLSGDNGGYWRNELRLTRPVNLGWMRPVFDEYGISAGYDQGVINNDRKNSNTHGRLSGNSFELFARGRYIASSVSVAHSLERPAKQITRESPIYFRLDVFL